VPSRRRWTRRPRSVRSLCPALGLGLHLACCRPFPADFEAASLQSESMGMEVKLAETGPIEGTNNRPVYLDMQVCWQPSDSTLQD